MKMSIDFKFFTALLCSVMLTFNVLAADLPDPDGKEADMSKPVQVYILLGQSNMLGAGNTDKLKGVAAAKYPYIVDEAGNWTVCKDVRNVRVMCSGAGAPKDYVNDWLSVGNGLGGRSGNKIGPEMGIGHHLGQAIDAPVLILKSCIGNRSLGYDLLPPSAEGYEGDKDKQPRQPVQDGRKWYAGVQYDGDVAAALKVLNDLGTYYPGATKYEVAGFFFWQGAKDGGSADNAKNYEKNLVTFIKDLRKDFNAPDALFTVATMGHGKKGGGGNTGLITDAQLAVDGKTGKYPEFKGNVATFYSNPVSMGGSANGHYGGHPETYMNVGQGMGAAMVELLKNIKKAEPKTVKGNKSGPGAAAVNLSDEQKGKLTGVIQSTLIEMSEKGELKQQTLTLSITKAKVWLAKVSSDTFTFQLIKGKKQASFKFDSLVASDYVVLSRLIAVLRPSSQEAQALAGLSVNASGNKRLASKYFRKTSTDAVQKIISLLE